MGGARVSDAIDVTRVANVCNAIGEYARDESGFVSVRSLMSHFRAKLIMRPLLVEAMIATVESSSSIPEGRAGWTVFVDSERYKVNDEDIREESSRRPLPARFRNTVAHELVHSLVFRSTEFGIEIADPPKGKSARRDYVDAIERATERMSPLMLLPEKTLKKLLGGKTLAPTAAELRLICAEYGVSRYVLINRLMLLRQRSGGSELHDHKALKDLAVGMGEWTEQGEAILKKWPLFINFGGNIAPIPLIKLANQDRLPAKAIVDDKAFLLCGGRSDTSEFTCDAGLPGSSRYDKMRVRITVETGQRRPGIEFLFAMSTC